MQPFPHPYSGREAGRSPSKPFTPSGPVLPLSTAGDADTACCGPPAPPPSSARERPGYRSPSGVEKEMRRALPLQALAVLAAVVGWVGAAFTR